MNEMEKTENQESQNLSDVLSQQGQQPAKEKHKCSICGSPDHRACGCEAKAAKTTQTATEPPPDKSFLINSVVEIFFEPVLDTLRDIHTSLAYLEAATSFLSSIDNNTKQLVELEKQRRDLLQEVQNGCQN